MKSIENFFMLLSSLWADSLWLDALAFIVGECLSKSFINITQI